MVDFYSYLNTVILQSQQFIWDDTEEFISDLLSELEAFEENAREYWRLLKADKIGESDVFYNECYDFCQRYNISEELFAFWLVNIDRANS